MRKYNMSRTIHCKKLNEELKGLDTPPFPGELGQKIYDNISQQAWDEWKMQQGRMINEYRLDLSNPNAREFIKEQMEQFLFPEDK